MKVTECKLMSGVNWQGALKQKGIKPKVVKQVLGVYACICGFFNVLAASSSPMIHSHKYVIHFLKMVQGRNMYCKITRTLNSSYFRTYVACTKYQRKSLLKALCTLPLPVIFH